MPESIDPNDFLEEKGIDPSSAMSITQKGIEPNDFLISRGVDPSSAMSVPEAMAKERLKHELTIKNLAGLIIVIGMIICGIVLFNSSSSQRQDQRTWAQSTLTLIIGGALGLLAGKDTSSGT